MNKYKIYCTVDNKWECVIASAEPTLCPVDNGHTVKAGSAIIIETDIQVNDGSLTDLTLPDYKTLRQNEVNSNTSNLVLVGGAYDSQVFSCSESALLAYEDILNDNVNATGKYTYPLDLTTKDHNTYALAEANVVAFTDALRDHIKGYKDSGRVLLKSIFDAADEAAVDAVVDNR